MPSSAEPPATHSRPSGLLARVTGALTRALGDALGGVRAARHDADAGPSAERHVVRGLPVDVENGRPDIATADVLARLDEALALVERHQPWRLAHLRRDVRRIRVARFASRGAFFFHDRTCLTELTFLARRDITAAPVAASIVHEGVHARVHALRRRLWRVPDSELPPTTGTDAAREERLCRRAELAFGRALPPALGAPVIERVLASLALDDEGVAPTVDWAEAARRVAAVDRAAGHGRA